uniref:AlNc14C21G2136 protein n=1 Tax=Albugo laibachii Nc14 TaxID=890382 RepID=F0W5H0_9STRA|nr:AlNc14C21G2136 [Albugo laibachii Nc14]|eukprot:CCA16361.1 AlNc14C21G2136 [Albugo laibachii Nc14]
MRLIAHKFHPTLIHVHHIASPATVDVLYEVIAQEEAAHKSRFLEYSSRSDDKAKKKVTSTNSARNFNLTMMHTTAYTYGLASFSNCDFERQRNALRQSNFARVRSRKRHQYEQDDLRKCTSVDDTNEFKAMQYIKRMRLSSPPQPLSDSNQINQANEDMLDIQSDELQEHGGKEIKDIRSMQALAASDNAQALVPVRNGKIPSSTKFESYTPVVWDHASGKYSFQRDAGSFGIPLRESSSCALIPIVQSQHRAGFADLRRLSETPIPRVEIIEDDDIASVGVSSSTDDDTFCRFEEIVDDEEPMDLD